MAELLHTRKQGNSVAVWAISMMVGLLVLYGGWLFLKSHGGTNRHPPVGMITHSTPVGGKVQDGVFHSSPPDIDLNISCWRI